MRVALLTSLCLIGALWAGDPRADASEASAGVDVGQLSALAQREGLSGDDLSTALLPANPESLPAWLTTRPSRPDDLQLALASPSIRVHLPADLARLMADRNHDGVPDRAADALAVARRTLDFCARQNLGRPADDGDGELDIYLLDLGGAVRGYAVEEQFLPPGRGAAGFVVADVSSAQDDPALAGMISRSVTRLVLAGHDATAPAWWSEASACWVQARVTGPSFELLRAVEARWNHPELGLATADPILARGNVSLLWALNDPKLENRALVRSWQALAARTEADAAYDRLDQVLREVTGLGLAQMRNRAAISFLASGLEPARYSVSISQLPAISVQPDLPPAPGGLALISIKPDPRDAEGTRLTLVSETAGWGATLLAQRKEGRWDQVDLLASPDGSEFLVDLPWRDYERAMILLERHRETPGQSTFTAHAESTGPLAPFALSSLAARRRPDGFVEISWGSTWERGLFGWLVEQAPSPEGPWQLVQEVALPALGLPTEGTGYSVLEERSRDQFPSYYRVVAVTSDGLRASGPVVAAGGI